MNLDDLRNYFHSDNETFEELSKQALRAKERELKDEVEEFKREKNELRLARLEQDRQLEDLMKELEMRRDREMRARIEKNQIQHALQEVQKNKITAQERDKRRELERLAAEREALALKEEQVIQDIRDLEAKMALKEEQIRLDKQRMIDKLTDINNPHKNTHRYREMQLAKERGEMIANIQNRRDTLEKDRVRIMDDL
jgi:DNA repair exonuclease SbcCD ATPase subunit